MFVVDIYLWCVTGMCWEATTLQFLLGDSWSLSCPHW